MCAHTHTQWHTHAHSHTTILTHKMWETLWGLHYLRTCYRIFQVRILCNQTTSEYCITKTSVLVLKIKHTGKAKTKQTACQYFPYKVLRIFCKAKAALVPEIIRSEENSPAQSSTDLVASAHPDLSLCCCQPFGLGVVAKDVEEHVWTWLEGFGWPNVLVVDHLTLSSEMHNNHTGQLWAEL